MVTRRSRGFTLIELLVVMAILGLLLSLAAPKYFHSVDASKETVLAENLRITRAAIDHFYSDRGRYPESLAELVARRYLRALPVDPLTEQPTTWTLVAPPQGTAGNVADLRSRSPKLARNGRPYAQW
ncbi:MAG: prepilin-type N-terminal cleavage/methylation domain-containing protein [Gammaproteobacteria bacterium]|nr:prepilin-type N-terminal cleavage/methylation domain-containing protein [Rhodocyclaceae bacterium]MBU3910324.1 prepilin-type N-terminal cleavage/methylation domain-containing protein [Gammaproteobacteria bacterium]MBU3990254.1 prepilin-type N-terminal cleavage/methylation domain-containing protein [Gammaproteobacteria bacterium]MBU4004151.1 prepilin-type N-terminal cleavage/methylation domain-containing protein [Gammaproteobacteria bacterium]MBU4020398.1 prepilin-type N-terminal cleavage/met